MFCDYSAVRVVAGGRPESGMETQQNLPRGLLRGFTNSLCDSKRISLSFVALKKLSKTGAGDLLVKSNRRGYYLKTVIYSYTRETQSQFFE